MTCKHEITYSEIQDVHCCLLCEKKWLPEQKKDEGKGCSCHQHFAILQCPKCHKDYDVRCQQCDTAIPIPEYHHLNCPCPCHKKGESFWRKKPLTYVTKDGEGIGGSQEKSQEKCDTDCECVCHNPSYELPKGFVSCRSCNPFTTRTVTGDYKPEGILWPPDLPQTPENIAKVMKVLNHHKDSNPYYTKAEVDERFGKLFNYLEEFSFIKRSSVALEGLNCLRRKFL